MQPLKLMVTHKYFITDYARLKVFIFVNAILNIQASLFANILPTNDFRLAYSPIVYPFKIFPRTVSKDDVGVEA